MSRSQGLGALHEDDIFHFSLLQPDLPDYPGIIYLPSFLALRLSWQSLMHQLKGLLPALKCHRRGYHDSYLSLSPTLAKYQTFVIDGRALHIKVGDECSNS